MNILIDDWEKDRFAQRFINGTLAEGHSRDIYAEVLQKEIDSLQPLMDELTEKGLLNDPEFTPIIGDYKKAIAIKKQGMAHKY